ncbi:hypothetical protein QQX98_010595 [Neonectria punicea]|uniref:Uncharacterized protein n=1 Tax=Neonectria punicea TaxID=979145 RepID=A0ABR1GNZ0_9HYPO
MCGIRVAFPPCARCNKVIHLQDVIELCEKGNRNAKTRKEQEQCPNGLVEIPEEGQQDEAPFELCQLCEAAVALEEMAIKEGKPKPAGYQFERWNEK